MVLASGVILTNFRFWPVWLTNFLKFKNFFCLRSPQLYGQLMPKIRFFLSDLPYGHQGPICLRPRKRLIWTSNANLAPGPCFDPQIPTFGVRYIGWICSFDNPTIWGIMPKKWVDRYRAAQPAVLLKSFFLLFLDASLKIISELMPNI